jgi:hypothetical protein
MRRLAELSTQSLSNIAWALGTLELVREESGPSRSFMLAVAVRFGSSLSSFSPQAISNIIWALSRVRNAPASLRAFGSLAATEAMDAKRYPEFAWQDRASIVLALMHCRIHGDPAVRSFAQRLIITARSEMQDISTQALLNIALAATRLEVDRTELYHFIVGLEAAFAQRSLNHIDRRQLAQVRSSCMESFGYRADWQQ